MDSCYRTRDIVQRPMSANNLGGVHACRQGPTPAVCEVPLRDSRVPTLARRPQGRSCLATTLDAAVDPAPSGAARTAWREITAILKLALFLRVDGRDIVGRESTILVLAGFALATWVVIDPLMHSRDLVFSWYALPDLACIAAGVLGLAWLLMRLSRPSFGFRRSLVLTLGALPVAMVGEVASWKLVNSSLRVLFVVLSVYALFYFARGLRLLTGRRQPVALAVGGVTLSLLLVSLDYMQANPRVWVRAEERLDRMNAAGVDWVRMARVQFLQQSRIDAAVARLAPQRPAVPDVFFLGFAGYGQEPVFAREIDVAEKAVAQRFDSRARSLRLVNDQRDVETWPIASEPALRHALRGMAAAMGKEDVLFLVLSSHGDRGQGVRVANAGMVTTRLDPASLDEMIREAGIQWRIIVVSACYSGSFVDALADERSIVITAAAPDRKSFGCNDSRWLTYFGEAFFQDAMAGTHSLRAAFDQASAALARKERASGIVPSMPRASFGALIEARLETPVERRIASQEPSQGPSQGSSQGR